MDIRLVVEKGPAKVRSIRLHSEETTVGRQKGCGIRIPSATVSRRHCLLRYRADYLTVEDLDSANGTFLNDERITGQEVIRPGDRLEIGPLVFVVEYQLTQATIDRLLRGDGGAECAAPHFRQVTARPGEPDTVQVALSPVEMEAVEMIEGIPVLDDEPWQLPAEGELRDILSQLDDR